MQLRNQLTAIFSPTRRLIGDDASILRQGGPLGALEWVVPRAQCHYRRLDFSALPPRQRVPAARLAVRRHESAPGSLHHIAWRGGIAHAWTWPQPDAAFAQAEQAWLPETLLRAPPAIDGPRLLRQVQGVEGQLWRDRQLVTSQWWPEPPGRDAWRRFLRAGGLGPEASESVPEPEALPWSSTPWGDVRRGLPGSPPALERLAWSAGLGIVALGMGWQLAAQATWTVALARVESRIETLRAQATPLLEARERADTALQALHRYRDLQGGANDYIMMADVLRPLPADARLGAWQREGVRLQVGVLSAESDPRRYVSAFDGHPQLADVAANPATDASGMQLDFTLAPAAAAGSTAADIDTAGKTDKAATAAKTVP